jgi:hypothetical protein
VEVEVGKICLDQVTFVAEADYEFANAMRRISLHDVPEQWATANLDKRLGAHDRFLADSRSETARENHGFQCRLCPGAHPLEDSARIRKLIGRFSFSREVVRSTAKDRTPRPPKTSDGKAMAPLIIVGLVLLAVYAGTKRLSGLQIVGVIAVTMMGIVLVIFPNLSTRIANSLGVGRGTDLIFYLAVLGGLFVASNFYFRFKRHEQALIALARESAIERAHEPTSAVMRLRARGDGSVQQVEQDLDRIES